jgi:hypothetical protein
MADETNTQQQQTTTTTTTQVPWFDAFEPEMKGVLQNKQWDKLDPMSAMKEVLKSYREAESKLGAPASSLVRIPDDPHDEAGWSAVHKRLGVPEDKTAYKFNELKFANGEPLDVDFVGQMHDAAHSAKLRPEQATQVVSAFMKFLDETDKRAEQKLALVKQQEDDALNASWGANREINMDIVKRTAAQLKMSEAAIEALRQVEGGAATMNMLLDLSKKMGEARFISGESGGGNAQITSAEQAMARKEELKNDTEWLAKYAKGDSKAVAEMNDLDYIIVRARYNQR